MPGIIVGVDGSDNSRHALEWAIREAAVLHAPLTVLTAQEAGGGYWGGPALHPGDRDLADEARESVQEETDRALEKIDTESRPSSVTVRAVNGLPAEALLAESADADMLVVGSRGAGGFKRLLMGSVSTQVTHHAQCPVVVVPAENI